MKKIILFFLALFSTAALANSTPQEAYAMLENDKAIIVDVREADEIKDGMIKKATWLPLSKINAGSEWQNDFLKASKDKKIFLYCRSGNRSGKFQAILDAKGIKAENLGGFETLKHQLPTAKAK